MYRSLPRFPTSTAALAVLIAIAGAPAAALAQETPPDDPLAPDAAAPTARPPMEERPVSHEISFRGRLYTIPDSVLDIWYFNADDEGWPISDDRPQAKGYGLGIEYCIKGEGGANGFFYVDYMDSTMTDGYWDDVEEPADHTDGSYLVPSKNFALFAFGADFGYEVHFVRTEDTNGNFGLSLIPGAGLGVAVVTGQIDEWTPDDAPSYIEYENGLDPDKTVRIPKVLPMVDINLALRFNFADRAALRVETGFHDVLFYGAALGIMF